LCDNSDDGQISLPEIGVAIEQLMGNAYRSSYTTRDFKNHYEKVKGKQPQMTRIESFHFRLTASNKSCDNILVRLTFLSVINKFSVKEKENSLRQCAIKT
jgi:hypothetical protein